MRRAHRLHHRQLAAAPPDLVRCVRSWWARSVMPVDVHAGLSDAKRACIEVEVQPAQPADLLAPQPEQCERKTAGEAVGGDMIEEHAELGERPQRGSLQFGACQPILLGVPALDDLAAQLDASARAPFLFVGAGVSRRYLKADGWIQLLKRMAALTSQPYAYYATKANNNAPATASAIAEQFHELWWTAERFAESREKFGDSLTTKEGPLKVEVARYTEDVLADLPTDDSTEGQELARLRNAVIDGVITTNYDGLLESLFPDYRTYVGQDELLFSDSQGIGEVYKIHGSWDSPESLVLTTADYERFNTRNPYLAAKLLTIFVEHPVIFLGYSLNDPNVTDVLVSIAKVLTTENLSKLQGQLTFVQWSEGAPEPTLVATQVAASGFTIPVQQLTVGDFVGLFDILAGLRRKFPARLLRQLKEHVYELVYSADPDSKLAVLDIDDSTKIKDVEVVFGVGILGQLGHQGYVGLKRLDLLLDVLEPKSKYDAARIVDEALPAILKLPGQTPVYRYLREAGRLRDDGAIAPSAALDDRVSRRVAEVQKGFTPPAQAVTRSQNIAEAVGLDFTRLVSEKTLSDALLGILSFPADQIDLEALRGFLLEQSDAFKTSNSTAWSKAVCLYDYRRFSKI